MQPLLRKIFMPLMDMQLEIKIKTIRLDNGGEFNMIDFYLRKGIVHQRKCVEILEQNVVVER